MTVAVCYKCGEFKFGAFLPCKKCGTYPENEEDRALSLVITDHYFDQEKLEIISSELKSGKPAPIDPQEIKKLTEEIQQFPKIFDQRTPEKKKAWWKVW